MVFLVRFTSSSLRLTIWFGEDIGFNEGFVPVERKMIFSFNEDFVPVERKMIISFWRMEVADAQCSCRALMFAETRRANPHSRSAGLLFKVKEQIFEFKTLKKKSKNRISSCVYQTQSNLNWCSNQGRLSYSDDYVASRIFKSPDQVLEWLSESLPTNLRTISSYSPIDSSLSWHEYACRTWVVMMTRKYVLFRLQT